MSNGKKILVAALVLVTASSTLQVASAYIRNDDTLWEDADSGGGYGGGSSGGSGSSSPTHLFLNKDDSNITRYYPDTHTVIPLSFLPKSAATERPCDVAEDGCVNYGGRCKWVRTETSPHPWWQGPFSEGDFSSGYCTAVHLQSAPGEGAIADFRPALRASSWLRTVAPTSINPVDPCFPHGCMTSGVVGEWSAAWRVEWLSPTGGRTGFSYEGPPNGTCLADPANDQLRTVFRDPLVAGRGMDFATCVWDPMRINVQYSYDTNLSSDQKLKVGGYRVHGWLNQTTEVVQPDGTMRPETTNHAYVTQSCRVCLVRYTG